MLHMNFDLDEVEYLGIFLTPQSKEKLKRVVPATFKLSWSSLGFVWYNYWYNGEGEQRN